MPRKLHNKLELMEEIINLGINGEEITIYNITRKINQKMKYNKIEKHYVGEQTISDIIKELERIGCLKLKSKEMTKIGKEKKIYELTNDALKIFQIYAKYYQTIHKIIRMLNELNLCDEDKEIFLQILSNYAKRKLR
ncbi:transcriptional regulator, AsnC family [Methanocaldococcus bathoardescens]|uniref:Transcriptional regulator, AsnC family n=1 Tax=Methanocaldococcus bathoardescens TaxID=1301915 RepID=A0A076LDC2_9EURY|nr:hypothetical protein [Methanocaldococcus bathoardescens]AIJ06211.1 transcriptional regulator, AsnC family [Methanocaldococcus bathoardescens]